MVYGMSTGSELDAFYVSDAASGNRQNEISENIRTVGPQLIWFGHADDEIRRAQSPIVREVRQLRQIGRISLKRSTQNPALNRIDLLLFQTTLPLKRIAIAGLRLPRRHVTAFYVPRDSSGAWPDFFVREKTEGRMMSGMMTGGAVLKQDRCDVFVKSRSLRIGMRGEPQKEEKHEYDAATLQR